MALGIDTSALDPTDVIGLTFTRRTRTGAERVEASAVAAASDVRAVSLDAAMERIAAVQGVRRPGPRPRFWEEQREVWGGQLVNVARMPQVFREDAYCAWRAYIYESACTAETVERLLWRADLYRDAQRALRELMTYEAREGSNVMTSTTLAATMTRVLWADAVCKWCAIAEWSINCRGGCLYARKWGIADDSDQVSARWRIWPDQEHRGAVPQAAHDMLVRCYEQARRSEGGGPANVLAFRTAPWHWDIDLERPRGIGPTAATRAANGSLYGVLGLEPTLRPTLRRLHGRITRPFRPGDDPAALYVPSDGILLEMLRHVAAETIGVSFEERLTTAYLRWFDYLQTFDLAILGLTPLQIRDVQAAVDRARAEAEHAIASSGFGAVLAVGGVIAAATATTGPFGIVAAVVIAVVAIIAELLLALIGTARGAACPSYPGPLHLRTVTDPRCFAVHEDTREVGATVDASFVATTTGGYTVPTIPAPLRDALAAARETREVAQAAQEHGDTKAREAFLSLVVGGVVVAAIVQAGGAL